MQIPSDDTLKASIDWYEEAVALYNLLSTHGELGARLISYCNNDIEWAQKAIDDHYCGKYSSIADFAQNLTEETHENIPSSIAYYIDYERMAQDMLLGGDIFVIEIGYDEVHIFWNF